MASERGEYRPIYVALLDGPDFQALTANERWVLVSLKLSLGMLGIGVMPGAEAALAERTGLSIRTVAKALTVLEVEWIERERNVIWLKRGFKFEPSMSPSNQLHRTSVARMIDALPRLAIVGRFKQAYPEWFDTLSDGPQDPIEGVSTATLNTETETETETIPETEPETNNSNGHALVKNGRHLPARSLEAVEQRLTQVLASVASKGEERLDAERLRRIQAALVFSYWARTLDHAKAMLDKSRENRLVKRLEENQGDVNELLYVVDGARKDDWTMGRDRRSTGKYDGIETLFQDRSHVEKFAAKCPEYKQGKPHPIAVKYLEAVGGEVPVG